MLQVERMDHKEVRMLNNEYLTKDIKEEYATKDIKKEYKVAISPQGHQYSGNVEERIKFLGFKDIKEAKKAGWVIK